MDINHCFVCADILRLEPHTVDISIGKTFWFHSPFKKPLFFNSSAASVFFFFFQVTVQILSLYSYISGSFDLLTLQHVVMATVVNPKESA